ncbi:CsgG/HfaB family protein [Lysobacter sp. GCM10012299]|uniref:CsgG/HfaB family protein n=1 Tax=Lysobacter sp. GCM10012299 TaxID=3317333 RepID=UPI0036225AF3
MTRALIATALAATLLSGCSKQEGKPEQAAATAATTDKTESFEGNPDFGGVKFITVEAEGVGQGASIAGLRALDLAISLVNGRRVSSSQQSTAMGVRIDVAGLGSAQVDFSAYAEQVIAGSGGAVRSFTVLSSEEIERVDAEYAISDQRETGGWFGDKLAVSESERHLSRYWKVRVKAEVARFEGPKDNGRPSIVVAAPHTGSDSYEVGDNRVDAGGIAAEIRSRLSDALTQTGRFVVLDRQFSAEMQSEVDFINSGNARNEEVARLGQRLATDLILVPTIEQFAYPRSSRKLQMSGRELTSYSGGGRISLKLINATTGEVVLSESFEQPLPPTAPSTLARSVDGLELAGKLMDSLSGGMIKSVVGEIFPISVVAMAGSQVVLSQGGKAVAVGDRHEAVLLGEELKDPQTGRSLGRTELPCCVIRVDRVADRTSYGTIEGSVPAQLDAFKPGMVELRGLAESVAALEAVMPAEGAAPAGAATGMPLQSARALRPGAATARAHNAADDANW